MVNIDADTLLAVVVFDATLFNPACVKVILLQSVWVFVPADREPSSFDFLVLIAGIALLLLRRSLWLGNRDESCINNLAATGLKALGAEI